MAGVIEADAVTSLGLGDPPWTCTALVWRLEPGTPSKNQQKLWLIWSRRFQELERQPSDPRWPFRELVTSCAESRLSHILIEWGAIFPWI